MHSFSEQMVLELFEEFSKFRAYLIENKTWSGNEQNFYSYYEKCIQNLLLIMRRNAILLLDCSKDNVYINQFMQTYGKDFPV